MFVARLFKTVDMTGLPWWKLSNQIMCPLRHTFLVNHTAVKRGARAHFPPKVSLKKLLNFENISLLSGR